MNNPGDFRLDGINQPREAAPGQPEAFPEPNQGGVHPMLVAELFGLNIREYAALNALLKHDHQAAITYLEREVNTNR